MELCLIDQDKISKGRPIGLGSRITTYANLRVCTVRDTSAIEGLSTFDTVLTTSHLSHLQAAWSMHSSKQASIKHLRSIQASKQAQDPISSKQAGGPQAWRLLACGHH
jgi:hypothetical protein